MSRNTENLGAQSPNGLPEDVRLFYLYPDEARVIDAYRAMRELRQEATTADETLASVKLAVDEKWRKVADARADLELAVFG